MAAPEQLTTKDLLFPFKDSFHSKVDADSLIDAMGQSKMLKKREIKYLKSADESAKMSFVFNKLYGADTSTTPDHVIGLFMKTGNKQNDQFSEQLRFKLSWLQKSATTDTSSVATILPVAEDVSSAQTAQVLTTPTLPPFKNYYPLDDNPSAIFTSTGGVLYSPVYGVTVYIPAGAILGEEQVEVSCRLVKEEAEIQEFLTHSLFEESVLCSSVFEFEAKLVNAPDGEGFTRFHSDVWIELPHCLSFRGISLNDFSAAFVMSERRGKVEVEEQALFSEGYPYVNLPVRHFSKFCVTHTPKKRFVATPKRRFAAAPNLRKTMQKLSISNSFDDNNSASPRALSKLQKQVSQEAASPSTATKRRALDYEMRKASSEASAEEHRQGLVRQDASDLHDEDTMEVDPPAPVGAASNAPLQQEPLTTASMSIMARVYQPRKRHKKCWWTADIVFAPHLHNAYKALADFREQCQFECCTTVFRLELRTLLIQLRSSPSTEGWSVELSTTKILLEQLEKVAPLLSNESGYSSKMADFLPKCTAEVQSHKTFLPLRHPIEVEMSNPPIRCYLTCEPVLDEVGANDKTLHCSQGHAQHDPKSNPSDSTQGTSRAGSVQGPSCSPCSSMQSLSPSDSTPFPPQQRLTIQWERDRYVLALLSIMFPEDHLAALGESLGLKVDDIMSGYTAGSTDSVGERAYEMFRCAHKSEQPLTFSKILVTLSEISKAVDLVPILRSYLQSFNMATSGTPLEGDDSIPNRFFVWLRVNHPTLIPLVGIEEKRTISPGYSEQDSLFLYLSPKLVCVWRMVGRLLGLADSDIEAIGAAHNSQQDRESEPCYQMLLKWVEHSQRPSDITYYRLLVALQLTSRPKGAANDAIFYLRNFVLNLNSAKS